MELRWLDDWHKTPELQERESRGGKLIATVFAEHSGFECSKRAWSMMHGGFWFIGEVCVNRCFPFPPAHDADVQSLRHDAQRIICVLATAGPVHSSPCSMETTHATPLDLQRQRGRDYVRRHRLRLCQRQSELREAVEVLERQLAELSCNRMEVRASTRYLELVSIVQQLQTEQAALKRSLASQEAWIARMCEVTVELMLEQPRVWEPSIHKGMASKLPARARRFQEDLSLLKATAVPVSLSLDDVHDDGGFGWRIEYSCDRGCDFFVRLSKVFLDVSADALLQRQWKQLHGPIRGVVNSSPYGIQDNGTPKRVQDGTVVVRSSTLHCPRTSFGSSIACQAFVKVPLVDGWGIACVAMTHPSEFEQPPPVKLVDVSSWIGLTRIVDSISQREVCSVELAAHWRFDTCEPERTRIINALQEATSWERSLMGSDSTSVVGDALS